MRRGRRGVLAIAVLVTIGLAHQNLHAFVGGSADLKQTQPGRPSRIARQAQGKVTLDNAQTAISVAKALDGRKLGKKMMQVSADGDAVVIDVDAETNIFGGVDMDGKLFGVPQGRVVSFNGRKDINESPLAVAWIDDDKVQGMFVMGVNGGKPDSEELGWASRLATEKIPLSMEGPIITLGLRKRWLNFLLKAAGSQDDGEGPDPLVVAGAVLAIAVLAFIVTQTGAATQGKTYSILSS